ncbi:hypothetical protein WA158_001987 [Blastocystis sp. Blastoise]
MNIPKTWILYGFCGLITFYFICLRSVFSGMYIIRTFLEFYSINFIDNAVSYSDVVDATKCSTYTMDVSIHDNIISGKSNKAKRAKVYVYPYMTFTSFIHPGDIIAKGRLLFKLTSFQEWEFDMNLITDHHNGLLFITESDNCISEPVHVNRTISRDQSISIISQTDFIDDYFFLYLYLNTNRDINMYTSFVQETASSMFTNTHLKKSHIITGYTSFFVQKGFNDHLYIAFSDEFSKSQIFEFTINNSESEEKAEAKGLNKKDINSRLLIQTKTEVQPVNKELNYGGDSASKKEGGCSEWSIIVKIREAYNENGIVYIPILIAGGPADFYYLVREEDLRRGDPSIETVVKYGTPAGNFEDEKVVLALNNYVPTVRNIIYLAAISKNCEFGVYKRRFFP